MNNDFTPKSRKENLVIQELEGEVLIYDLVKNKAFCLNNTSALVWQSCDGSRTIADISDALGKQLNSQVNEDIIWLALEQLSKENLIEKKAEIKNKFAGLSRREVIRKVGIGSMIALPVIATLVAPTSALAQGTVCGRSCNGNGQCSAPCPNCNGVPGSKTCQA